MWAALAQVLKCQYHLCKSIFFARTGQPLYIELPLQLLTFETRERLNVLYYFKSWNYKCLTIQSWKSITPVLFVLNKKKYFISGTKRFLPFTSFWYFQRFENFSTLIRLPLFSVEVEYIPLEWCQRAYHRFLWLVWIKPVCQKRSRTRKGIHFILDIKIIWHCEGALITMVTLF